MRSPTETQASPRRALVTAHSNRGHLESIKPPAVSVVIPAYNESDRIADTVTAALTVWPVTEVIVVDDGSQDATARLAQAAGATVIRLPFNQGKGAALARGIREAAGEIVVLLDADVGRTGTEIEKLIWPVLMGEADMTIAQFPASEWSGGFGLAKGLAKHGIRLLAGLDLQSPLSGQRAIRRDLFREIAWLSSGFGVEVGLTIDAVRAGYRVMEVPVTMTHRQTGRDWSGIVHRGREFMHIAWALARRLWRMDRSQGRNRPTYVGDKGTDGAPT